MEDKFYICSKQLYAILKRKGITNLYHANTVLTSLTFINNRSLLSRGYVESNNLNQTPQSSDNEDKKYDVWNDVFLDGKDFSTYFNKPNHYGPVLFVMKLDLLNSPSFSKVLVTKSNPWYWKDHYQNNDRYYSSIQEIEKYYLSGSKNMHAMIMFTFRDTNNEMKLNKFCERIILDRSQNENFNQESESSIRNALKENSLGHINLEIREKNISSYSSMVLNKITNLFKTKK